MPVRAEETIVVMALLESCTSARRMSVLIVEDHTLLADALVDALDRAGITARSVVGPTADDIVATAREMAPALILLDLVLGDEVGLSVPLVRRLSETGAPVVMLTGVVDPALLGSCLEAGAVGLVSKNEGFDTVLEKVERALRHETTMRVAERDEMLACLRRQRAREQQQRAPFERLTTREREVLGALMDGCSAEEIASSAFVSLATVRSQIRSILEKLGVHSQVAAVAFAHRARWEAC
jgi:two-component system, NarL family, nitrate/nitrite response regulator NarL